MKKDFYKKTLSNGIKVYLYSDENLKRLIASYNVNYGSLGYFDRFYYDGRLRTMPPAMAHFLEHTLIETAKKGNMLLRYKEKNYEVNGLTYPEVTSYYFIGIKDTWESLKELIQMIDDPAFDRQNIEDVKRAVAEEANKSMDDTYRIGYNANRLNAFSAFESVHKTYNTLGTKETTYSITLEDVQTCYDAYYNDENKFLVIGGNFDIDEMVDYLEEIYKELRPHPNKMKPYDYGDLLPVRKTYEELVKPVATDHVIESFKLRNDFEESKFLLNMYFHFFFKMKLASDTEFITELAKDKVIVGGISHSIDFFRDVITVTLAADVLDEKEFLKRLDANLNTDGLEEKSFELFEKKFKGQ